MDPLSILASSLAVATATQASLAYLLQLYGARLELCALSNELADLIIVLGEINRVPKEQQTGISGSPELILLLQSTLSKLKELRQQTEEWVKVLKQRRLRGLMAKAKLDSFRSSLQTLRLQLIAMLSATLVISLASVHLDVRAVYAVVNQLAAHRTDLQKDVNTQSEALATISQRLTSLESLAAPPNYLDRASEDTTRRLFDTCNSTEVSAISIPASRPLPVTARSPRCGCACHRTTTFRSSGLFEAVLGGLFVGYTGSPKLHERCDKFDCRSTCASRFQVTYTFPRWFLAKVISVAVTAMPAADPTMVMTFYRTVAKDAPVFYFAKTGNVEQLKHLFSSGLASPNDVHCMSGVTALDFAISYRRLDTIKFLLDSGANPMLRSKTAGTCPSEKAWSKVLARSLSAEEDKAFRELFAATEDIEGREFTALHTTVLKLDNGSHDLRNELENSSKDIINLRDSQGMTALNMAAELGSAADLQLLLSHGADPSIPAKCQKDPLIFAARSRNPDCVAMLLNAGASVSYRTSYNHTALHYAAIWSPGKGVEHLLAAGMDVNFPDKDGRTPLGFTVVSDNFDAATRLMANKARIRCPDAPEVDPFLFSIRENRHRFIKLFIDHNVDTNVPLPNGQTVLHVIAQFADEKTMDIFTVSKIKGLSINKEDNEGITASEIVKTRQDSTPSLVQSFYKMLQACLTVGLDDSGDDEYWEDAVEEL